MKNKEFLVMSTGEILEARNAKELNLLRVLWNLETEYIMPVKKYHKYQKQYEKIMIKMYNLRRKYGPGIKETKRYQILDFKFRMLEALLID